ncbi:type III ribulose-bisphosphate carboxylase [archaeon]|nr:type III ribulose-bisphosphate carboxylase [archaeon]|tara:strand:- start:1 stop:1278 length:1278 start_codon:yes stop_codon:yes gene_type:complete
MKYSDYVKPKYRPGTKEIIAEFYIEPNRVSLKEAAGSVAAESSVGTWTDVTGIPRRIRSLRANVFSTKRAGKGAFIKISYPVELFEKGSISQLLSSIGGNVFGMKTIKNLKLYDIHFPESYTKYFKGPAFGIKGVRHIMGIKTRSLIGTIIKPKLGLNEKEHAKKASEAWIGGLDIVKDDENLTSMTFNKFDTRLTKTLDAQAHAENVTGEEKAYMPNVTAPYDEMLRRAHAAADSGSKDIMVDIVTVGFSGLQQLTEDVHGKVVIHAHRAGHGMFTHSSKHGMSMVVLAKLARLAGVDQIHIGTASIGKMVQEDPITPLEDEIEEQFIPKSEKDHILAQKWYGIKPVFAVASGGLHPGMIPELIEKMGTDIIMQFGGGCHGHPEGTVAGAMAIRQALDSVREGFTLKEYAKYHSALKVALKFFR